jgi:hypothetical protein
MKGLFFILSALFPFVLIGQTSGHTKDDSISKIDFAIEDTFDYFSIIDTNYLLYSLPIEFNKPPNWLKAEKSRLQYESYGNEYSDSLNLVDILSIIDTAKDFRMIMSAKSWCLKNYEQVFPYLVARLSMKKKIGLQNTADLIIWDRFRTGDLKFYGHGGGMNEDIFTISGRAAWILNQLTGEEFAVVQINLSKEQAIEFKNNWVEYIEKLN